MEKKDFDAEHTGPGASDTGEIDAGDRRRRRRKLRVPSDNVPRPQQASAEIGAVSESLKAAKESDPVEQNGLALDKTMEMPAISDEDVVTHPIDFDDEPDSEEESPRPDDEPEAKVRADSDLDVDIEISDDEEAVPGETNGSGSAPVVVPARASAVEGDASPEPAAESGNGAQPPRRKFTRAETVELREEDLMEAEEALAEHRSRPPETPATPDDAAAREAKTPPVPGAQGEPAADDDEADQGEETGEAAPEPIDEVEDSEEVELTGEELKEVEAPPAKPAPPEAQAPRAAQGKARPPAPPPAKQGSARAAAAAAAAATKPPPDKAKKRRGKAWFEEIFDEDYLRTLPFLTPQTTQREAQFLTEGLKVDPGAQVLDVGCGYGRHVMELAARGFHCVGLDLSLPLLIRGADEAQRRGLTINFVHGDMRELTFEGQFDGAFCVFSTFGYFDDETNKKVAKNIARALKPGARFVVDVLNRDYVVADLPSRVWWEGDGCVVLEEVDFNYYTSRIISNRSIVFEDGRQVEQEISMRVFSLHEIGKLLHQSGFRVLEISGSLATRGHFFGRDSRQLLVIAEKRGADNGDS